MAKAVEILQYIIDDVCAEALSIISSVNGKVIRDRLVIWDYYKAV